MTNNYTEIIARILSKVMALNDFRVTYELEFLFPFLGARNIAWGNGNGTRAANSLLIQFCCSFEMGF
jgi:hypothetical protein